MIELKNEDVSLVSGAIVGELVFFAVGLSLFIDGMIDLSYSQPSTYTVITPQYDIYGYYVGDIVDTYTY